MDPNTALDLIRQTIRDIEAREYPSDTDVAELIEHVRALDEWLSRGGFLPRAWRNAGA